MTQASPHVSLNGSRLVRFLADLAVSDDEVSHKHFADRLGRLIDLADSISLSETHGEFPAMVFEPTEALSDSVIEEFLEVRRSIVQSIVKSFVPGAGLTLITLPRPTVDASIEEATAYEPYRKFYAAHQRDIDFRVQTLRANVRDAVSGLSAKLAQLAALDTVLDDTLSLHSRKFFAVVPKLLGKRFEYLLQEHKNLQQEQALSGQQGENNPQQWSQPGGWLAGFYNEMQGLLLAELEVRLQPVLGLIEALNDELNDTRLNDTRKDAQSDERKNARNKEVGINL